MDDIKYSVKDFEKYYNLDILGIYCKQIFTNPEKLKFSDLEIHNSVIHFINSANENIFVSLSIHKTVKNRICFQVRELKDLNFSRYNNFLTIDSRLNKVHFAYFYPNSILTFKTATNSFMIYLNIRYSKETLIFSYQENIESKTLNFL